VADHLAVINTLNRWSFGYDLPDFDLMASALTAECELTMRIADGELIGPFSGREACLKLFSDSLAGQSDQRRHLTVNHAFFDEDENRAEVKSVLALLAITAGRIGVLSSGVYSDTVVKDGDGWRIAKRHISLDLPY
jgi:hypothetical protein